MQAAVSELTLTQQELEREVSSRRMYEETAASLKVQVETYKRRERDLETMKEEETRSLLASIREECNLAFDKRGMHLTGGTSASSIGTSVTASGSKSSSPRSVVFASEDTQSLAAMTPQTRMSTPRSSTPSSAAGSTGNLLISAENNTDLDRALDETEALVRSLVGS
jgi:hypothetical protein